MTRITRTLAVLLAAAALAAGLGITRSASASGRNWVCVYVDHVHVYACQGKPIDFYPDDDDRLGNGDAVPSSVTNKL